MIITETVIILVNYDGYNDTENCIESLKQLNPRPFIVIIDNASKDAHKLKNLSANYSPLHIIYNPENIGFGRANNLGIRWAQKNLTFDYLCLLNNDTVVNPDFLDHLKKPFKNDPKIGITTGKIFYEANRDLVWYGGGEINYTRGWPRIADYNKVPSAEGANSSKYVSFVSGCLMLFTKDSIATLKGFDEQFFMYCEDLELCIRAKKAGLKLFYNSDSVIYHKVQGGNSSKFHVYSLKNPKIEFYIKNIKKHQFITFTKHLTGVSKLIFITFFSIEYFYLSLKLFLKSKFKLNIFSWFTYIISNN